MITCFDTMINFHQFQKLKLLGNGELNHITIIKQGLRDFGLGVLAKSKFLSSGHKQWLVKSWWGINLQEF